MSLSSFVPSSCFHGYPSLCAVHYLSLPPFPSLSLSLCSYLSHFAFISASLPLSHTLLTPAFISFHFHLSFTFLSPSSLPFHHAVFFQFLTYGEWERAREREKSFICCPYQFCIFNHFPFTQSPVPFPLAQSLIYMCARRSGQLLSAHPWAASLFVRLSEEGLACKELQDESNLILCVLILQRLLQHGVDGYVMCLWLKSKWTVVCKPFHFHNAMRFLVKLDV